MTDINLKNLLNRKYTQVVIITILLVSAFVFNFFLTNSSFKELKVFELNQYEYIPTLNGSCIYSINEIEEWLEKSEINSYEVLKYYDLNQESKWDKFNIDCFGKISGSSLPQNNDVTKATKNIDLIVYPQIFFSHILILIFLFSIKRNKIAIENKVVLLTLLLTIFSQITNYFYIFLDSYSWILMIIISNYITGLTLNKKYILFFISFLFGVNTSIYFLILYILVLIIDTEFKFINLKHLFKIALVLYLSSRVLDLSYSLRFNNDHYVWIISAMRMEALSMSEYLASWDHKGPVIYLLYFLALKIFSISNIWLGISIFYLLVVAITAILFEKILITKYKDYRSAIYFSISILVLILTLDPNAGLLKFDTRFIGSFLILLAVYFYLVKENLKIFSLFLFLATFNLGSFVLIQVFLSIFVWSISKHKKNVFKKLFTYNAIWTFVAAIYLQFTNQLYEFFILNIKFNLGLSETYNYYSTTQALLKSSVPVLFFVISFIFYIFGKKLDKHLIIILWTFLEILHIDLTGPRFPDYQVVLYIPLYLSVAFLFLYIVNNSTQKNKSIYLNVLISSLVAFSLLFSDISNYPKNNIGENNLTYGNRILFSNEELENRYENLVVIKNDLKNYNFGFLIADADQTKFNALFKHHIIPTTRMWLYPYHFRSAKQPWDNFFSDTYFEEQFLNDVLKEKPRFLIIENSFNLNDTYKKLIKKYVEQYKVSEKCFEYYCIIEMAQ